MRGFITSFGCRGASHLNQLTSNGNVSPPVTCNNARELYRLTDRLAGQGEGGRLRIKKDPKKARRRRPERRRGFAIEREQVQPSGSCTCSTAAGLRGGAANCEINYHLRPKAESKTPWREREQFSLPTRVNNFTPGDPAGCSLLSISFLARAGSARCKGRVCVREAYVRTHTSAVAFIATQHVVDDVRRGQRARPLKG